MRSTLLRAVTAAALCVALVAVARPSNAQVFNFTLGAVSAQATFSVVGSDLHVLLQNTSELDSANAHPNKVLTGLFFDVECPQGQTATLAASSLDFGTRFDGGGLSTYVNGTSAETPGQHWGFASGISADNPYAANYGFATAGLGIFGPASAFEAGGSSPVIDGVDYGLVGNATATPGGPGTPSPQIWDSVEAVMSGMNANCTIANVNFQYGTQFGEAIPTPNAALVLLAGGGLTWLRFLRPRLGKRGK